MADARDNAGAPRPPLEVDRFEHVVASPQRTLLRLDGRYSEAPGAGTLDDAVLLVDDRESVRRHVALPDPNRTLADVALLHELRRPRRVEFARDRPRGPWRLRFKRPDADRLDAQNLRVGRWIRIARSGLEE